MPLRSSSSAGGGGRRSASPSRSSKKGSGGGGGGSGGGSGNSSSVPPGGLLLPASESFSCSDPSKLTDSEMDCLKEAFALFDADHDGEITVHELGRVMKNHGLNPTEDELKDMIRNVDKNSDGAIDFNEFIEMMLRRDSKVEEDVLHAFRVFDRDGDGLISAEELKLTMNNLGEPLTDHEVRSMIEAADLDGDGLINFQEFSRLMQNGGPAGQGQGQGQGVSENGPPTASTSSGRPGQSMMGSMKNNGKCA